MLNETTENFLQVMAEFKWPEPKPIFYRLYYNDDGTPKCYTMEDLPGKYVEIDREMYVSHLWNVRVVAGKIKIIPPVVQIQQMKSHAESGTACDPRDICVIVDINKPHIKWTQQTNETN